MSREKRMMNRRKSNNRNSKSIEKKTITEHITNIVSNKKLLVIMIVSVITLVTLLSTSFAMLMKSDSSDVKDLYKSGTLTVQLDDAKEGTEIDINPAKPISDDYAIKTIEPYEFTITNTGTTNASYEVYLIDEITNSSLTDDEVRQYIRYQIDDESPRSLAGQGSNIIVRGGIHPEENLKFKLRLWIDIDAPIEMEGTTYSAKVGVKGKATNKMQPNGPEIADGLIPVVYDEKNDVWKKADTSTSWYNYEKQEWANAVTVTSETREKYMSDKAGTTIDMNDINTMWVWIPRYKYRILSNIGSTTNVSNPPEIDVIFESRYEATGVSESVYRSAIKDDGTLDDTKNVNGEKIYYTHPAFIDGTKVGNYNTEAYDIGGWDREITGIWVSKFALGLENNKIVIKPNVRTWGVSTPSSNMLEHFEKDLRFAGGELNGKTGEVTFNGNSEYGLTSKADTHTIKNTEWGMIAYLSQSRYGKMGNNDYDIDNKQIYCNNTWYINSLSGSSTGSVCDNASTLGYFYKYNDEKCTVSSDDKQVECTKEKVKNEGQGASTTGTIYGIYNVTGATVIPTMANYKKYSGTNAEMNSGFNGLLSDGTQKIDGKVFPNRKYYDLYTYEEDTSDKNKAIMGDSTWEASMWYYTGTAYLTLDKTWYVRSSWFKGNIYRFATTAGLDEGGFNYNRLVTLIY